MPAPKDETDPRSHVPVRPVEVDHRADAHDYPTPDELDAELQQRADFVREALNVERTNRAMVRSATYFLYGPTNNQVLPGSEWKPPDCVEPDELTEAARNVARRAAYARLARIFTSDLPSATDRIVAMAEIDPYAIIRDAYGAAFGCPIEAMTGEGDEDEGDGYDSETEES